MSNLSGPMATSLTKSSVANRNHQEESQLEAPPSRILVIGYGNTLRGDDGLGWHAAERLRDVLIRRDVSVMTCHQLTMDLSEPISQATHLILIDASTGPTPGIIAVNPVQADRALVDSMHHHMPPAALLAYTQALFGECPPTWLWTITAANYDFGDSLSPAVERALPDLVARIAAQLENL